MGLISERTVTFNKEQSTLTATLLYKGIEFSAVVNIERELRLLDSYEDDPYNDELHDIEFIQDGIVFHRMSLDDLDFLVNGPCEGDYYPEPDFEG